MINRIMFALKVKGTDRFLPKTPYIDEEMDSDLLTDKPDRIAKYKHRKVAERRLEMLLDYEYEIVEL